MATHDYIISNASGAAVRADLNNALAAIVTNNSSATAPTTTYAYQWWADTGSSPAVMKLRNAANSAWITLFQLDGEWTNIAFENGTAAAPSIYFKDSGTDTGIYSPGTDQVAISTGGSQRATVDASGRLLVGATTARSNFFNVSTISGLLQIEGTGNSSRVFSQVHNTADAAGPFHVLAKSRGTAVGSNTIVQAGDALGEISFQGSDGTEFVAAASIYCEVDTTPGANDMPGRIILATTADGASSPTERVRFDSSGSVFQNYYIYDSYNAAGFITGVGNYIGSSNAPGLGLAYRGATNANAGVISFGGLATNGNAKTLAAIVCQQANTGANRANGLLRFLVNQDTATDASAIPTEAMRITNGGSVDINTADGSNPIVAGRGFVRLFGGASTDASYFESVSGVCAYMNRRTTDGELIQFRQDGTAEGSISVSGTTVSYNGAHLSRWSQLPGGAVREEILRGTVLSNVDEMCGWDEEENEQLNRMKISDVEGDPNVSGVFQAWDDDDDTYTDDFYCAMTGDFIIRIAEDVTVQRGDLLMSAGDGTAKPQDDDIIRSKTIAKVTSTHVTCTYEDGSYCVPCVLMAC
jgi:hypothetical protein